jgi:hypothetical protein
MEKIKKQKNNSLLEEVEDVVAFFCQCVHRLVKSLAEHGFSLTYSATDIELGGCSRSIISAMRKARKINPAFYIRWFQIYVRMAGLSLNIDLVLETLTQASAHNEDVVIGRISPGSEPPVGCKVFIRKKRD